MLSTSRSPNRSAWLARRLLVRFLLVVLFLSLNASSLRAQMLEQQLLGVPAEHLAAEAREQGDAARGAIVFHQPHLACRKCHMAGEQTDRLGPDLTTWDVKATDAQLVDAVLRPSRTIREGFETLSVITLDGKTLTGLLVSENQDQLVLRDASRQFRTVVVPSENVDERSVSKVSLMPAGQVNTLAGRQQFLDLIKYLMEIRDGGRRRALALEPPPSLYAARPLPEYEQHIDHAGMVADLGPENFRRGEAIYNRLCVNCHGTREQPGSLPTSLRFATGKFKNGGDPYTMYQTLTRGFGMMVPQTWMVPSQKYDVIHYIREAYLKPHNPSQYVRVDADYLAGLPKGTTRGPEPSNIAEWERMDYGPNLVATYEIGDDGRNFAYKGNAVRLDAGPGGVSRGRHWIIFDYDTLRAAAAWSGRGFIDWNGINFNGRHAIHPRIVGRVQWSNPTGPGWADPRTGRFDDPRLRGRDGRPYGPLPREWARYQGMYYHGDDCVIAYSVGQSDILELGGLELVEPSVLDDSGSSPQPDKEKVKANSARPSQAANASSSTASSSTATGDPGETIPVFLRTLRVGPRPQPLTMQVAHREGAKLLRLKTARPAGKTLKLVSFGQAAERPASSEGVLARFDGATRIDVGAAADFEMRDKDFTILARFRTQAGGTLFAQTAPQSQWVPDGKTLFVRGGRLAFDIGWVGVVTSRTRVADGKWHDAAVVYTAEDGQVQLFVDGRAEARRPLQPKQATPEHVVRIGYTSENFPREQSYFQGDLQRVRFFQRALSAEELARPDEVRAERNLVADWKLSDARGERVPDLSGRGHEGRVVRGTDAAAPEARGVLVAGLAGDTEQLSWIDDGQGNLRLEIAAGDEPLQFTVWTTQLSDARRADAVASVLTLDDARRDLRLLTRGGPSRWPQVLTTKAVLGDRGAAPTARGPSARGPFVVDVLTHPESNPWFCRMRLTGFDFFPDGDRAAVCSWDGNVWLVSGLSRLPTAGRTAAGDGDGDGKGVEKGGSDNEVELRWRRIASGLFQPLGLKIIDGRIFVTCRDQICVLHDLNGDGEADFLENFNNDHQVTEHFHEFAMGLQVDQQGNLYYAKSARHALPALVPHHGTLLRVSKDGRRTDILATGFRAANGVCLNPDGTFIVTDQEGHWNPKNRINWVKPGGFYGNMYGYHDVTDSSDSAMEQPLCWITNAFDRSPAELLWADSSRWGPLQGSLLNLSYGYGKVFVVPFEEIDGQKQGGMCELPLPAFPTGLIRGRFYPADGQLYACGMFAWAGSQHQPGGFYRIRYTGRPVHLPVGLHARKGRLEIIFSDPLDPDSTSDTSNYHVKVWSLKRTANYGSPHVDEHPLRVASAELSSDHRTLTLHLPEIAPTWCMEVKYSVAGESGAPVVGTIHNTIHALGK